MTQVRHDTPVTNSTSVPDPVTRLGFTEISSPQDSSRQLAYSSDVVEERRYGCYRLGTVVAIAIILILVAGTVPLVFVVSNRQILLQATCLTLIVVLILLFVYTSFQKRAVRRQRDHSHHQEWAAGVSTDRQHNAWRYTSVPTTAAIEQHQHGIASLPYSDKHHSRVTTPTSWAFRTPPRPDDQRLVPGGRPTGGTRGAHTFHRIDHEPVHVPSTIKPHQPSKHTLIH